jgi:APA family basic amino acid/polyamine antiporter
MTEVSAGARGAGPSSDATPFVRQSSGLVKSGTPYRMFLMNAAYNGLGTYMAFFYFYSAGAFPRGNLVLGVVIVAILQIVFNGAYALLAIAYPRSGGEYVYLSRIVHPAVGFAVSVGAAIAQTFWVAVGGYWVCTLVLAPALTAYGGVTGHPGAIDAGKWFAVSNHAWLVSAIAIVLSALLVWRGLRVYFRFQSINWWIGWICFAVFLVVLGTSSHQDFINGVNRYGENTSGIHNAYQTVLNAAQKGGMPTSFSLWQTLGITAVFTAVAATAYVGGEVRKPRRTQLIAMVGGSGSFAIISVLVAILLAKTVSTDWNRAASWLAMNDPHHYPFAVNPVYMWYADLLTTHPTVVIIMTVGFVIWSYFWIPICMLWATRMVFAWSFDRLVPAKAAAVSEKTGSPTVAVVAVAVIAEFLLWLYARGTIVYLAPIVLYGIVWAFVGIAAVLFPFMRRSRDTFEKSDVRWRIGGIPVVAILGLLGFVYWTISLYFAFTTDLLGANTPKMLWFTGLCFAVPFVFFFVARWYRSRQGVDIDLAFAELPPD